MIQLRCDSVVVVTVNNIFLEKVLQQIIDIVAFELKPICAGQIEHIHWILSSSPGGLGLGGVRDLRTGHGTKTDGFSENFQNAFDSCLLISGKSCCKFFSQKTSEKSPI